MRTINILWARYFMCMHVVTKPILYDILIIVIRCDILMQNLLIVKNATKIDILFHMWLFKLLYRFPSYISVGVYIYIYIERERESKLVRFITYLYHHILFYPIICILYYKCKYWIFFFRYSFRSFYFLKCIWLLILRMCVELLNTNFILFYV